MFTTTNSRILIAYGTTEGHTARIAQYMAGVIRNHGSEADTVDLSSSTPDLHGYDAVIVGSSIHMGKHDGYVRYFVLQNCAALKRLPSAFFSVSLAAHDNTEEARKQVEGCIEQFVQQTGWRPDKIGVFAGALLYTHYGFFKRWIMRKIARDKGSPDLDTSQDYIYTDWVRVRRFAQEFLELVVPEAVPSAPW
jgi:menaquinone-dependent protoporphyrinogen oxidase